MMMMMMVMVMMMMMMIDDGGDADADDDDAADYDDTQMLWNRWIITNSQKYWTISHLFRLAERPRIGTGIWGVSSRCPDCQVTDVLCRVAKWEGWSVQQKLISEHQSRTLSSTDVPALQSCVELDARSIVSFRVATRCSTGICVPCDRLDWTEAGTKMLSQRMTWERCTPLACWV